MLSMLRERPQRQGGTRGGFREWSWHLRTRSQRRRIDAGLLGEPHHADHRGDAGFGGDMAPMDLDGLFRGVECGADLLVEQSGNEMTKYLQFPCREHYQPGTGGFPDSLLLLPRMNTLQAGWSGPQR